MKTFIVFIGLLTFLLSCGTMRLKMKAPYKTTQGSGTMVYERSYDVGGGMPLWCGLTAIFYGGACWAYLAMPFVPQEKAFVKDATEALNEELGTSEAVLESPEVERLSWTSAETFVQLNPDQIVP